jgi:hypothetical protein
VDLGGGCARGCWRGSGASPMRLKRKVVAQKYAREIEELFATG